MTTIAITGAGGQLGTRLVRLLDADPAVTRIVGVDHRPPKHLTPRRFEYRPADVRDPDLARTFRDVDVVVHLAARIDPMRDDAEMRAINVAGTRAVVAAAAEAGVRRVVLPSSVVVYGAHPDNDVPLVEDSPLRGIEDLPHAEHLTAIERALPQWLASFPQPPACTVLRFALMLGPDVDNVFTRALEAPKLPAIAGHRPPMQFLHPDDAARAIAHVIEHDLDGVFNVAADGWLSFDEVAAIIGRGSVEVPEEVAWSVTERLWTLGLGDHPPGLLTLFMYPAVMSAQRLEATGWSPLHSNRDALAQMAVEHAAHWSLPGVRVRRRTVGIVAAVTTAAVAVGVVAAVRALRDWRRARREG